uniref:NIM1 serine/threonine protein kinase n=1 Tax=Sphaeramia orbicularis TaxID=375764 RepID=A0A672ZJN8_9TELE
ERILFVNSAGGSIGGTAGVTGGQRYTRWSRQDSSDINTDDEGATIRRLTPLEKLNLDMCQDERVVRELTVGRRIGFYKIRGEIGCGNFSHVKLGIHALTKGEMHMTLLKFRCTSAETFTKLRCILNAPIERYVTAEREPNASLNNAY